MLPSDVVTLIVSVSALMANTNLWPPLSRDQVPTGFLAAFSSASEIVGRARQQRSKPARISMGASEWDYEMAMRSGYGTGMTGGRKTEEEMTKGGGPMARPPSSFFTS